MAPSPYIAPFNLIGQEVPTSYVHVEQLIRQLRLKVQQNPRDGKRSAFFTLTELREGLSKHLQDLSISDTTFSAALKFLHEVGDDVYWARDQQIYSFYIAFSKHVLYSSRKLMLIERKLIHARKFTFWDFSYCMYMYLTIASDYFYQKTVKIVFSLNSIRINMVYLIYCFIDRLV